MKMDLENKLIAVIRVRGTVGVRHTIAETLRRLNLRSTNNMTLVYGTKSNLGMIKQCSDFVTYGPVKQERLSDLLAKKGVKLGKDEIESVSNGKKSAKSLIKLPIRMHPPKHGYEGLKKSYAKGGALGYRGEEINDLIKRMA